jgi:hypothetical protein
MPVSCILLEWGIKSGYLADPTSRFESYRRHAETCFTFAETGRSDHNFRDDRSA